MSKIKNCAFILGVFLQGLPIAHAQQELPQFVISASSGDSKISSRFDLLAQTVRNENTRQHQALRLLESEKKNIEQALGDASLDAQKNNPEVLASVMMATAVGFASLGTWALTQFRTADLWRATGTYGVLGASSIAAMLMSGYSAYWQFYSDSQIRESLMRRRTVLEKLLNARLVAVQNYELAVNDAVSKGNAELLESYARAILDQRQSEFNRLRDDLKDAQTALNRATKIAKQEKSLGSHFNKVTMASSVITSIYLLSRMGNLGPLSISSGARSLAILKNTMVALMILGPAISLAGQHVQIKIADQDLARATENVTFLQDAAKAAQQEILNLTQDLEL